MSIFPVIASWYYSILYRAHILKMVSHVKFILVKNVKFMAAAEKAVNGGREK